MYDFLKYKAVVIGENLLNHNEVDFDFKVCSKTGEPWEYPMYSRKRWRNQEFRIFRNCFIGNGSIHKYWQNGTNWEDFSYLQFKEALHCYCLEFGIDPATTIMQNIEFGINIIIPFEASLKNIIETFISYKAHPFEKMESKGKKCIGVVCKFTHYQIKVYSKTLQYGLNNDILRIEIKNTKMQRLSNEPIYLSNLLDIAFIKKRQEELIQVIKDIIIMDKSLSNLSLKEKVFVLEASNPIFWSSLTRSQRNRNKTKYNNLVKLKSTNFIHKELIDIVIQKCDVLTKGIQEEKSNVFTPCIRGKNVPFLTQPRMDRNSYYLQVP